MLKKTINTAMMGAMALSLVACSHMGHKGDGVSSQNGSMNGEMASSLEGQGVGSNGQFAGSNASQQQLLTDRTYHFAFDSSAIASADKPAIIAQANYLSNHPNTHVLLAGNTDIRGSREYNIALGWRRAKSVEQMMLLNGAKSDQIRMVSYGAEKPVANGDTTNDFALNRRVELTYES